MNYPWLKVQSSDPPTQIMHTYLPLGTDIKLEDGRQGGNQDAA